MSYEEKWPFITRILISYYKWETRFIEERVRATDAVWPPNVLQERTDSIPAAPPTVAGSPPLPAIRPVDIRLDIGATINLIGRHRFVFQQALPNVLPVDVRGGARSSGDPLSHTNSSDSDDGPPPRDDGPPPLAHSSDPDEEHLAHWARG